MPNVIDPLQLQATAARVDNLGEIQEILKSRKSLRELSEVAFLATPQFKGHNCVDIYGEFPFGLFVLDKAVLIGANALILTSKGELLIEQNAGITSDLALAKAYCSTYRDNPLGTGSQSVSELLSLVSACCYCFYHWIMDCLPKIVLAEMSGYKGLYLAPPAYITPWVAESARILAIDESRLVTTDKFVTFTDKLYIPTYFSGFLSQNQPEFIASYRHRVLQSCTGQNPSRSGRLHIPRKQSCSERRVVNQKEVSDLLKNYDFDELYFEDLSLPDQIAWASGSNFLIGPHGSGMIHSLFLKPQSTVIEFFPHYGGLFCYQDNTKFLQHKHYHERSCSDRADDIEVNIESLRDLIEKHVRVSYPHPRK